MKKIILFSFLFVFLMVGCTRIKEEGTKSYGSSGQIYTLIPMSGYTTLQIQYKNSTTVRQFKLPSKPDMFMKKIENITYTEATTPFLSSINIKFSSDYTTQFAELTGNNKENYLAIIAGNIVVACPVIKNSIPNPNIPIPWSRTKEEASQFIESLKDKPLEFYCINRQ